MSATVSAHTLTGTHKVLELLLFSIGSPFQCVGNAVLFRAFHKSHVLNPILATKVAQLAKTPLVAIEHLHAHSHGDVCIKCVTS